MRTPLPQRVGDQLRRRVGAFLVDNGFRGLSRLGKLFPSSRPERHRVRVIEDVAYAPSGSRDHLLDIYRPEGPGPHPVLLYIHGGGFRILSKDSHWLMGLAFARRGYLVFNINYRLAPRFPYPAAIEDCCRAFTWVLEHAAEYGGDLQRLAFAGESAGGNLVTALALACCYERPEPWAREVFARGVVPKAVVAACGLLQVSDIERLHRRRLERNRPLPRWLRDRLEETAVAYLGARTSEYGLADPLVLLESAEPPARPLPPFFAPVGTKDPLLDDTRRLARALDARGVHCRAVYYPGELHAFHALFWRPNAKQCWRETFSFLREHLEPEAKG